MKQIVLQIVFLAVIAQSGKAEIILPTSERETVTRLYETMIDFLVECYLDGKKTVGVVGDSDGIVLQTLWRKKSISAVLIDSTMIPGDFRSQANHHELEVFVIIANKEQFMPLIEKLQSSVWWNHYARFFIMSSTPDKVIPPKDLFEIAVRANFKGLLNAQLIDLTSDMIVVVTDFNPFMPKAPQQWKLYYTIRTNPPIYMFLQYYRKGEQTCEALDFPKTTDLGGHRFVIQSISETVCELTKNCTESHHRDYNITEIDRIAFNDVLWFIDNIQKSLNASVVFNNITAYNGFNYDIYLPFFLASGYHLHVNTKRAIYTFDQVPIFVVTQHTAHMTQLEKILSVIDKTSQIGMYLVYLITFIFFKFFLRQPVMSAVLNLVRLTCSTGLPKLPNNLAPTIYLACLFMFVITLQAIYTGNLASLLTQTIAYPHVDTKADIAKLGYTIYTNMVFYNTLAADPILDGRVVKLALTEICLDNVLRDSLAACPSVDPDIIIIANAHNLHISRYQIQSDYSYHSMSPDNPLGRRVQDIMRRWHEAGLRRINKKYDLLRSEFVDDDEVKKNVVTRVMTFDDLRFAFVIWGIGLSCSLFCFIVELLIAYVRSKYAKRCDRVRPIIASGKVGKKYSWCSPLEWRFTGLRLFSRRR